MSDEPESGAQAPQIDLLEELGIALDPRVHRGRLPAVPIAAAHVRDLTEGDLVALATEPRGVRPPSLQRIHSSHHAIARLLASGMQTNQIALITGYSPARISVLERDPTFQGLVADYRTEMKDVAVDIVERMRNVSLDALEILHERLLERPEEVSLNMALDIVKAMTDRTGHGPNAQLNLNVNAGTIDRPPRETAEEWNERRLKELGPAGDPKLVN